MKKYIITAAMFAACLALCAAMWPQNEAAEETLTPIQVTAVSAPGPTIEGTATEAEITPPAEEEKEETAEAPQVEPGCEGTSEPELAPEEIIVVPEVQPTPEPEPRQESAPAPIPSPAPPQAVTDPQPGDIVYVPGFGWLECQGPGEVIYDENIYENGNKIGIMG